MLASRLAAGSAIDLISTWCPSWLGAHAVKKADEQDGPIPVVETPQMDFWIGTGLWCPSLGEGDRDRGAVSSAPEMTHVLRAALQLRTSTFQLDSSIHSPCANSAD